MKLRFSAIITLTVILGFAANGVWADTYSFIDAPYDSNDINDPWKDWPGTSTAHYDEIGDPWIDSMDVFVEDGHLKGVNIVLATGSDRLIYDSLFINTSYTGSNTSGIDPSAYDANWDDWDYFIRDGYDLSDDHSANTVGGVEAADGFYLVDDPTSYAYTTTQDAGGIDIREGNPNGIHPDSLTLLDDTKTLYGVSFTNYTISYTFAGDGLELDGGFFIAYSPWCANDVIGGGAPVPEPATVLLFGTGLIGLLGFARRRNKK